MSLKRSAEEEIIIPRRYTRIKLASPSPTNSSISETESIHSCQGYETEYVKDTSDTATSADYDIEFEVAEDEDGEKQRFYFTDESDSSEAAVVAELYSDIAGLSCDSVDIALLGDTSEENSTSPTSNSDVDPELPRNDYLDFEKCLLCKTDKKNISYPYCSKCFTWKKNLFPGRPRRKHKLGKKEHSHILGSSLNSSNINGEENSIENGCSSMESENLTQESNMSQQYFEDSGMGSSGSQVTEEMITGSNDSPSTSLPSTSNSKKFSLGMCRVCFQAPENGLFVHMNIAHVYGCYACAKKIWYNSGSCPICRRKIFKVAKLFV